jgi:hypothetical protein
MADWWSIEVFHGGSAAWMWWQSRRQALTEAAITHGAQDWRSHEHRWGIVFEVRFAEDWQWDNYHDLPAVQAALDAVPDPVGGLLVHRGPGGSAGSRKPRDPRPRAGGGAAALPEPQVELHAMLA